MAVREFLAANELDNKTKFNHKEIKQKMYIPENMFRNS